MSLACQKLERDVKHTNSQTCWTNDDFRLSAGPFTPKLIFLGVVIMRLLFVCFTLAACATAADASSTLRPWGDRYRVILWCGDRVEQNRTHTNALSAACRELGITTLMTWPGGDPAQWQKAGFDYYVENLVSPGLCLKFRSSVTDWDAFVTAWSKHRRHGEFIRDYSLTDAAWRESTRVSVQQTAVRHAPFSPVLYDLRDELSITVSGNPFDYDFSPASLSDFRHWLAKRYPSLAALNAAWCTAYATWDEVTPFSTDEIKTRMAGHVDAQGRSPDWHAVRATRYSPHVVRAEPKRWHLAPWCDFRSFMDDCLAETLADLRTHAQAVDPATPVGIEGTQMPSAWGGYDLWKLSRVLDWVEPYDITAARAVFGSFMRGKPILATYGERDPVAVSRRMWHLLLEGDCGAILWWSEDLLEGSGDTLRLSAKGRALAPVVHEMQSPLARLLLRAERLTDPVAVHYSQASIQLAWLFESFADGATWPRRFSSFEAKHNRHAALRTELWQRLRESGWSPQFVSYEELEKNALAEHGFSACFLPDSFALSEREALALQRFAQTSGKSLLYTGEPGVFLANGTPRMDTLFPACTQTVEQLAAQLPPPAVRVITPDTGVCVYRFRTEKELIFALEQRQHGQTGEDVTQSVTSGKQGKAIHVAFAYGAPRPLFDLRTGQKTGEGGNAYVDIPFERPLILGFSPLR